MIPIISEVLGFIKPANLRKPGYVELALQFNITHSEAEYKYQRSQSMRLSKARLLRFKSWVTDLGEWLESRLLHQEGSTERALLLGGKKATRILIRVWKGVTVAN